MMKKSKLIALSLLGLLLLTGVALTIYFMIFKKKGAGSSSNDMMFGGEYLPQYATADVGGSYSRIGETRNIYVYNDSNTSLRVGVGSIGNLYIFKGRIPSLGIYGDSDLYSEYRGGGTLRVWGRGVLGTGYSISLDGEDKPTLAQQ
jgi:hypothetical protein